MPSYDHIIQRIIPEIEHHQNRYARGLSALVRPGCQWLDIGAGTRIHDEWVGVNANEIAGRADFLVGCDMVGDHLRKNASLQSAVVADAMHLPFSDRSFDLVTANMVLEHLEAPGEVFAEVTRVLRPGGAFAFVTPNVRNPVVWGASVLLAKPVRKRLAHLVEGRDEEHIFHTFYRANSRTAIRDLAAEAALRVEEVDVFNSYPFIRNLWPLTVIEAIWIKALSHSPLKSYTTNLFGVLRKP